MKTFAIASPYGTPYCYDYVVYLNLRDSLAAMGLQEDITSRNRIYLLGFPVRPSYLSCGKFDPSALNIGLVGSYYSFIKESDLKSFKFIYCSSPSGYDYILKKFKRKPDGIWNLYSPFGNQSIPTFELTASSIEIPNTTFASIGNARLRPAVDTLVPLLPKHPEWSFSFYGYNLQNYRGNKLAKQYARPSLPYHQFLELPKHSKIVLLDMHDEMAKMGMPSFKYIDLLMSKNFVMVYDNKYVETNLKGITFTKSDFEEKALFYLRNESERQKVIDTQYDFIQETHSVRNTAKVLKEIIDEHDSGVQT